MVNLSPYFFALPWDYGKNTRNGKPKKTIAPFPSKWRENTGLATPSSTFLLLLLLLLLLLCQPAPPTIILLPPSLQRNCTVGSTPKWVTRAKGKEKRKGWMKISRLRLQHPLLSSSISISVSSCGSFLM